jgi:2-polyprenyl-3-methyl-5-hydroxy-6-metoxy-1,4-benzoquinol methylase
MSTYDTHYREEHLFGEPYREFVDFITTWPQRGEALDLGCGQGRDALFLASAGFRVTAIDVSQVGVTQMLAEAQQRGIDVNGIVADFYAVGIERNYDLILFNSILHFEKPDRDKELRLLTNAASHVKPNGLLCIFVHKSKYKETIIKQFFEAHYPFWEVIADRYIDYTYEEKSSDFKSYMQFYMYIVQHVMFSGA